MQCYQSSRFRQVGTGHLWIHDLQLDDSGVYECRVVPPSSTDRTSLRSAVTLLVGHAPRLVGPPSQTVSGNIQVSRMVYRVMTKNSAFCRSVLPKVFIPLSPASRKPVDRLLCNAFINSFRG